MNTQIEFLKKEISMQNKALKNIELYRIISFTFSCVGVLIIYFSKILPLSILGYALTIISFLLVVLLSLGLKNGKRNVEKMILALEKTR